MYNADIMAQVLESEEFLALSGDTLASLLDSDRITVRSCLGARSRWYNYVVLVM